MGMAASQARFLNLTARKTNIEFHGQQINQQRTELSNESANLYNQMLSLQVPVPPNTQDYTKVQYTFQMPGGGEEATISQMVKDSSNKYTVVFSYKTVELGIQACPDNQKPSVTFISSDKYRIVTSSGRSYETSTATKLVDDSSDIHGDVYRLLGNTGTVYYINVGTEETPKYQYFKATELPTTPNDPSVVTSYTAGDVEKYNEDTYTSCTINRDKHNRIQSFTTSDTTFAVTTKTITDEDAYNDAMNEYSYQSYLYEQEMNNINAQISIVHAQDRELELKLKQLDTEHNAVQTEIDSVQQVAKKNVEDSFKTFA